MATQWGVRLNNSLGTHEIWLDEAKARLLASASPYRIRVIKREIEFGPSVIVPVARG